VNNLTPKLILFLSALAIVTAVAGAGWYLAAPARELKPSSPVTEKTAAPVMAPEQPRETIPASEPAASAQSATTASIGGVFQTPDGAALENIVFSLKRTGKPGRRARTRDAGRFAVADLEPGRWTLSIPPGAGNNPAVQFRILAPDLELAPGENRDNLVIEAAAEAARRIGGQVLDNDGRPLPGTKVTCDDARTTITATSEQGRFLFDLAEGAEETDLYFSRGNYEAMVVEDMPAGTTDLQIVMERGGTIAGMVQSAGNQKAITPFNFRLDQSVVSDAWNGAEVVERIFEDPAGKFRFEGIVPGKIIVEIWADGFARKRMEFPIQNGEVIDDIIVELPAENAVRGSIVGAKSRRAISGVRIYIGRMPTAEDDPQYDAVTDKNGVFTLNNLTPGDTKLGLVPEGEYAPKMVTIEPGAKNAVIELPEAGVFSGAVSFQGRPVSGAPVTLYTTDNGYGDALVRFRRTDENGHFYFDTLPAAKYYVETGNPLDESARMQRTSIEVQDGYETTFNFQF
jgi:uncharacterized GH25 family protein